MKNNGLYGFIDIYGKQVIPCVNGETSEFHNGIAYVIKNGEYFIIDRLGQRKDFNTYPILKNIPITKIVL